jgi:hypothetical protein
MTEETPKMIRLEKTTELTPAQKTHERSVYQRARILEPWMRTFAEWEVEHPQARPLERYRKAEQLSGSKFSENRMRILRNNGLYREYREVIRARNIRTAKALMEPYTVESVQAMRWALGMAIESKDYRAVATLASPGIERAWPRRDDPSKHGDVNIQINLSPGQAALLDRETPIIEAEIVAPDPIPEG